MKISEKEENKIKQERTRENKRKQKKQEKIRKTSENKREQDKCEKEGTFAPGVGVSMTMVNR